MSMSTHLIPIGLNIPFKHSPKNYLSRKVSFLCSHVNLYRYGISEIVTQSLLKLNLNKCIASVSKVVASSPFEALSITNVHRRIIITHRCFFISEPHASTLTLLYCTEMFERGRKLKGGEICDFWLRGRKLKGA